MIWAMLFTGLALGILLGWLFSQLKERNASIDLISECESLRAQLSTTIGNQNHIENVERKMQTEFENLANRIFDERGRVFSFKNSEKINDLLRPLHIQLKDFRDRIDKIHTDETRANSSLLEKVSELQKLNSQVSADAKQLTNALKGDSKKQGNWGELIVKRVLESSGLVENIHFQTQMHLMDGATRRYPDFVIHLPNGRDVIIDSKVSLTAYVRSFEAENPIEQKVAMQEHIRSIRAHIKELAEKDYSKLDGVNTIDQVIMCVPNEAALIAALNEDGSLHDEAFKNHLLLVGPSTLLFALKIVDQLWRQFDQDKNAIRIADRGQKLYDKLVDFIENLTNVGTAMDKAKKEYENAFSKLSSGTGNLIRQAEMLKELGVKTRKNIPKELLDITEE